MEQFNLKRHSKVTQDSINFIINNYDKLTNKEIARELNIQPQTINNIIKKFKLNLSHKKTFGKNNANLDKIKEMKDPDIIYILGYLWADGHLPHRQKNNEKIYIGATIQIMTKDFNEIETSINKVGRGRIYKYDKIKSNFTDNGSPSTKWILTDIKLGEYLKTLDFNIKSYVCPIKLLNLIPDNLKHYFWLGFFDGDGCLFVEKGKTVPHSIQFSAHKDFDWKPLIEELSKINIESRSIRYSCHGLFDSRLMISKRYFQMKFLQYIYQNKEKDDIGLDRKYQKYLIVKDHNPEKPKLKIEEENIHFKQQCQKYVVAFSKNGKRIVQKLFKKYEDAVNFKYEYLDSIQNKI